METPVTEAIIKTAPTAGHALINAILFSLIMLILAKLTIKGLKRIKYSINRPKMRFKRPQKKDGGK
ncbi:hypothetical protein [Aquirhabdus sp.]|uniref:hypothetical protein n=1 Tax=Aquirhabdus sp. TaxID=2824160 RepID=UPI00396C739B